MKLVIDISENDYELACRWPDALIAVYAHAIKNGTPLPKGHGRLIDADEFEELFEKMCPSDCGACSPKRKTDGRGRWYDTCSLIDYAHTIIEAESEDKA